MSPVTLLLALASINAPVAAPNPQQDAQPHAPVQESSQSQDETAYDLGTISAVTSSRRGAALGGYEPEAVLDAETLKAYGAGTIEELMSLLEPLTRSSRGGSPVYLVNGRRISGFQEIRGIPPEAIERTEILPEETALSYGYTADQRVVNFVLKQDFRSVAVQGQIKRPDLGGRTQSELETNIVRIGGTQRWTFDVEYEADSPLYESERDIYRELEAPDGTIRGDDTPLTAYQTLNPRRRGYEVTGSYKRDLESGIGLTISGNVEQTNRMTYLGLPGVVMDLPANSPFSDYGTDVQVHRFFDMPSALSRESDALSANINALADGYMGEWRWTVSGGIKRNETETTTGRGLNTAALKAGVVAGTINPFSDLGTVLVNPNDEAKSINTSANVEGVLNGKLWQAPTGALQATFKAGFDTQKQEAENLRFSAEDNTSVYSERSLSRDRFNASGNFNLPLASRDVGALGKLGDLSTNLNVQLQELSDFGSLNSWTLGFNWSPWSPLNLTASYAQEQTAPSMAQLNDPTLTTPNVPVYDFATGQSVIINRIEGGNSNLSAEDKSVLRLGMNFTPFESKDLRFTANYTRTDTDGVISGFPTITPALEAALPERFDRDIAGNLVSIDARPLNYENSLKEEIRWGLNFSTPFGKPDPAAMQRARGQGGMAGGPAGGPPPGGAPRAGGGGPRMAMQGGGGRARGNGGQMQPGQGRLHVSLYHTYRMTDEITIRQGLPVIDLLDGGATGSRGGQSQNELQLQGGLFKSGMGAFLNANWAEGTRVAGGSSGDLNFSDLATVNLNLFADLGQRTKWVEKFPWLTGSRVSVGIENLFDERISVTDAQGNTPNAYQPHYMDPMGRTFRINFRKIIF